jgi:hypothetical protein
MTQYLISFDDGAMIFPEEEMPDVAKAAHEVVHEATDAGVWVFSGGLETQGASVVATDGTVTDGPYPVTQEVPFGNGRTIAWTAHDDEFSSRDRSLAVAEQPAEGRRARCPNSMVNVIAIIVRRSGAMSLKPC